MIPIKFSNGLISVVVQDEKTREEELDMIKDFAEIAALKVDHAPLLIIKGKENALEEKILLAKRRRRL